LNEDKSQTENVYLKMYIRIEIEIDSTTGHLNLSQAKYISKVATLLKLNEGKQLTTPMDSNIQLKKTDSPNDNSEFRTIIGILLFISHFMRPDISHSIAYLARFTGWVSNETLKAAQRVVKYVYQTKDQAISFTSSSQQELQVFIDTSFAPNVDSKFKLEDIGDAEKIRNMDLYSISGYAVYHFGNIIAWGSMKQKLIALSSTQPQKYLQSAKTWIVS